MFSNPLLDVFDPGAYWLQAVLFFLALWGLGYGLLSNWLISSAQTEVLPDGPHWTDAPLKLFLGYGVSVGVFSQLMLVALWLDPQHPPLWGLVGVLWGCLAYRLLQRPWRSRMVQEWRSLGRTLRGFWGQSWCRWDGALVGLFLLSSLGVGLLCLLLFLQSPYGGWDATMIWNHHAKFLAVGGAHWHRLFDIAGSWWHENHYPLLLPGVVASGWVATRTTSVWIPFLIAMGFALSGVGILGMVLARLSRAKVALGGMMVLLATPYFFELATQQLADIPFSVLLLSGVACWIYADGCEGEVITLGQPWQWRMLSGWFAGLAMWTKQEGLLLLVAALGVGVFSCMLAWANKKRLFKHVWASAFATAGLAEWLWGILPFVLLLFWYRAEVVAPKDVYFTQPVARMMACLTDWYRYEVIWQRFLWDALYGFGGPMGLLTFGIVWALVPKDTSKARWPSVQQSLMVLVILGILYTLTYLLTPFPLLWQMYFSSRRLWMHLWPVMILLACLLVKLSRRQPEAV